ncbi:Zf-AD domain-containing protein [Caenorhabditis elegans]|uniref:Zf-AD domain-containing protein n=1 Tax=Caenorhabditis elegans TaxID=6239 RepID=Q9TYN1_CAEEL|nr:Zf-AD domain-containing protein [Caenorhabditis elegans]CCD61344.1 Zf-AD domain-containing protein [Caenorhabditis elegans]|eukprot:NP_500380.1 Uncharacterized protein CELE_Y37E11B.6 [Caenorhabditis elegans]
MGRSKKGENKNNNGKKNVKNKLGYARAEHLHRCAIFLSKLGSKNNDGFSKTSRHVSKLCRQVMDTEMVHLDCEQKQQFCKICREVLVGNYEKTEISVKQRGSVTEKCGNCHKERNYMTKAGYGETLKEKLEKLKKQ